MKKKTTLIDLLDAEWQRACALLMMWVHIEDHQFEYAIEAQLEYLYWTDEWAAMYPSCSTEYWRFKAAVRENP